MTSDCSGSVVQGLEARILQLERDNRELTASQAYLRAILDNEPECVKVLDADGSLLEMNPAGLRMLEADSIEQVRNHCVYPLIVEEHREAFRTLHQRILAGGGGVLEFELVGLKGGRRWLQTHASPLRDDSGSVTAMLGITRDITERKLADDALRATNRRLDDLLEGISDAFLSLDRQWRFVYVNDKAAKTFGRPREQLIGRNIWDEFPQLVGQPFDHAYRKAMAERVFVFAEDQYASRDWWFENRIYPVDEGISVFVTEITARKRSERALAQQLLELEQLYRTAPVGLALLDRDLRFVRVNERLAAIDGRPAPDHIGRTLEDVVPALAGELRRLYQGVLDSGQPVIDLEISGYTTAEPQVEHHWVANYLPVHDDAGAVIGVSAVVADVTERKRAEAALREKQQLLSESQRIARIGSWHLDPGGKLTWSDETYRIYGVSPDTFTPQVETFPGLIHPHDRAAMQAWIASAQAGEKPGELECRTLRPDGSVRYLTCRGELALDQKGRPRHLTGTVQDITDRKLGELSLHKSEQRLLDAQRIGRIGDWDLDLASGRMTWSAQVHALYERDPALEPPNYGEFLASCDAENRAIIENRIARLVETGEPQSYVLSHDLPSGAIVWNAVTAIPVVDDDGRVACVRGIVQDITAVKQAEIMLRQSEQKLHMVMDGLGPHMFVGLMDLRGAVRLANRAARAVASLSEGDVVGLAVEDTYWFAYSDAVRLRMQEAVRSAARGESVRYDECIRVAEGEFIWIDFSINPLRDDNGAVVSLVPSAVVIDERKKTEEALRREKELLRLIIEHSPSAIAMFDRNMRYVVTSRRYLADYGLAHESLAGRAYDEVFPDLPERWKQVAQRCLAGAIEKDDEDSFEQADGAVDFLRWEVRPWRESNGDIGGILLFSEMITERKVAELKLREAAARQQSLARRLAEVQETELRRLSAELHDRIGQNLTALGINLNIFGRTGHALHSAAMAERLRDSHALLEATIASVRDLIGELRPPVLDDYGLLAALRWFAEQQRGRNGLEYLVRGDEPVPRLEPRVETAMFRIAQEALTNVVKHAQAQRVELSLQCEGDHVTLEIADDGCGFDLCAGSESGPRTHWGREMMAERAQAIDAELRLLSTPGQGTRVVIDFERAR